VDEIHPQDVVDNVDQAQVDRYPAGLVDHPQELDSFTLVEVCCRLGKGGCLCRLQSSSVPVPVMEYV